MSATVEDPLWDATCNGALVFLRRRLRDGRRHVKVAGPASGHRNVANPDDLDAAAAALSAAADWLRGASS